MLKSFESVAQWSLSTPEIRGSNPRFFGLLAIIV